MSAEEGTGAPAAEWVCTRFLVDARDQDRDSGSVFDIPKRAESLASLPLGTGA